jgi:hypothetical protein
MTTTYNVYRNGTLLTSGLTSPAYVDTGLTNGTLETYQVSATVNGVEGPKSSPVSATPGGLPVPPPPPLPPPSTTGAGPRPAPATPTGTGVVTVPGSIDATGATDVSAAMQTWVNAQSDGSTLIFPSGATYKLGTFGIAIESRNNLTFFGYGCTLHNYGGSTTRNSAFYTGWAAGGSTNIKILGFTIKGGNPNGGTTSAYTVGQESAQGFTLNKNAVNWEIADNTITDQWGHGIYVHDFGGSSGYSRNLNFHFNAIARTGVMGIAVANGIGLTFADNTITDTGIAPIDIEDASAGESIHSIWFLRNVLNKWSWSNLYSPHAIVGDGPGDFNDIRVQGNILQGGQQNAYTPSYQDGVISFWGAAAKGTMIIDSNNGSAIAAGLPSNAWAMRLQSVNGLTVTNNYFSGMTGTPVLAHKVSCTSVVESGNTTGNVIASFSAGGSSAAFLTLMADMTIDVIEMAAGTYAWTDVLLNIDRSSRPLIIRPAAGATVTFDGSGLGTAGMFYAGLGGYGSYFRFQGLVGGVQKFVIQNYTINDTGLIWTGYVNQVEFSGFKVRTCTGSFGDGREHCMYVSSDGTHSAIGVTVNDWDVDPDVTNRTLCGLQIYHTPAVTNFTALRWKVNHCYWGFVGRYTATNCTFDGWTITNTGKTVVNVGIPFDCQGPAGVVRNMTSTGSPAGPAPDIISSPMVDGGGNSWA